MDDDVAWEKWDIVENEYFELKEQQQEISSMTTIKRNRNSFPRIKPAVRDALDTADYITAKLGVKTGIAQAAAISMVEKTTGLELEPLKKLLPAAGHETGCMNATEVGQKLGVNAIKANKMLAAQGLQEQIENSKGHKEWHITDKGKEYGEEFPYNKNGHSGYQIKWSDSVLAVLTN